MSVKLQKFEKIYGLYLLHGGSPSAFFNSYCGDVVLTADDVRNEQALYVSVFEGHGSEVFQWAVYPLIERIRTAPFNPEMAEYADIACAQALGAKALYQYNIELSPQFVDLIRIFDQVETTSEKKSLWTWAQTA